MKDPVEQAKAQVEGFVQEAWEQCSVGDDGELFRPLHMLKTRLEGVIDALAVRLLEEEGWRPAESSVVRGGPGAVRAGREIHVTDHVPFLQAVARASRDCGTVAPVSTAELLSRFSGIPCSHRQVKVEVNGSSASLICADCGAPVPSTVEKTEAGWTVTLGVSP